VTPSELSFLICAPHGRNALVFEELVREMGFPTETKDDLAATLEAVTDGTTGLIVEQEALQRDGLDRLTAFLEGQPEWADMMCLLVLDRHARIPRQLHEMTVRWDVVLHHRPLRRAQFANSLQSALNSRRRQLELKQLLDNLRDEKEKAKAAYRVKSVFLSQLSHDIRTPLTAILGFTEVLSDREDDPDKQEIMDGILESSTRLLETLDGVLELSKLEGREQMADPESVNVASELRAIGKIFQQEAISGDITFTIGCDEALYIRGNRNGLHRILLNLVGNAIKFTPAGGEVKVGAHRDGELACVTIDDDGPGISENFMPQLFQPFQQDKSLKQAMGGSGLGLAISQQLARLMGGELQAENRVGGGSRFVCCLPTDQSKGPASMEALDGEADAKALQMLVVEDAEHTRRVLRFMLPPTVEAELVGTYDDAVGLAQKQRFDLVFLDIDLGETRTGRDLLRELKQHPNAADAHFVAFTAFASSNDKDSYYEEGFDGVLPKPFTRKSLQEAINQGAEKRRA